MHITKINVILAVIFFLMMTIPEVILFYKKQEEDKSDLFKKILLYLAVSIFICIFTAF